MAESKSRWPSPWPGGTKSSGKDESKAPASGSSSSREMVGIGVPQESSGRDEYGAPLGSSSSHATHESKETSGEDQSEPPGGSSPPRARPESREVKDSSGEDESRTLAPGSISPRTPIRKTTSNKASGANQSRVPMPGASPPSPSKSISRLFGLVVGPDKSSSPPGRGRLINPTIGGTAAPNESQGPDKSKSERSRTPRGVPIVESSFNKLHSNDQKSHASPNRSIVRPGEGCEDAVVESTSNKPQTPEQSDASPSANNTTVPLARDSPEVASVADSTSNAQQTFGQSDASPSANSTTVPLARYSPEVDSVADSTSNAQQTTEISFAKSRAEYTTGSGSTSREMTEKYQVSPVASRFAGLTKNKPGRSRYKDRTCLLADTSVYLPPAYNLQVQMPPRGIYTSKSPEQDAGESQSSSGLDEPKAPARTEELHASPVIDNPRAPSLTAEKGKVPKSIDQIAHKWGSKLGSPVIYQSESTSSPSTGMNYNLPNDITEYGLIVGPDPNYVPTGKGRYIMPVVRPTGGPNESQGTDKSKMKDTDESKSAKTGGIPKESKAQYTEESKSESAFLDGLMGKEDTLAGVPVYISGSTDKRSAIILISDIYGFTPRLFRKVADKVAADGYLAVIPDYFNGDPYKMVDGENPMSAFPDWLAKHPAATVENVELTKKLIEFMKDNYGTTYVGLAGFGYGAKIAVTVGKDHDAKAIVQLNPLFVEASDYEEVAVPMAVVAASEDGVDKHMKILESRNKNVKVKVNIYVGVVPGWPVRYDEKDETAVKKAKAAHKVMLKWFRDNM